MQIKKIMPWTLWLVLSAALVAWLLGTLLSEESDKTVFLPGQTSSGHYQIELACNACHTTTFADELVVQNACMNCHGEALKAAKDDHPKSKFTDPRNAERIAALDARYCVTCHVEHRPEITHPMGVTVPPDTCYLCHEDIGEDRPSHSDMPFDTCTNAGCHNFHDNRALYEDFLLKHMDEDDTTFGKQLLSSNLREIAEQLPDYPLDTLPLTPVTVARQLIPQAVERSPEIEAEWLASSHAQAGVNCTACHTLSGEEPDKWLERPDHSQCATCHAGEVGGFLQGKHGMRLDIEKLGKTLSPMSTGLARLPMKHAAAGAELNCQSCHAAHRYDSATAPVDSCLNCHDDEHSLAYPQSSHYRLWQEEMAGALSPGSGVTCASCHMPRLEKDYYWGTFVHHEVQHNQSDNLRPNEKMIRPVCMECHGLGFAIDALADENLIRSNFSGKPAVHVPSIELAKKRLAADAVPPASN